MKKVILLLLVFVLFFAGCYPGSTWNHAFYNSIEKAVGVGDESIINTIYLEDAAFCIYYDDEDVLCISYLMMKTGKKNTFAETKISFFREHWLNNSSENSLKDSFYIGTHTVMTIYIVKYTDGKKVYINEQLCESYSFEGIIDKETYDLELWYTTINKDAEVESVVFE